MPKYRITTPDGRKYVVTAPEGATQEEVLAYAQSHHSDSQPPANDSDFARLITGEKKQGPDREQLALESGMYGPTIGLHASQAAIHHITKQGIGLGQAVLRGQAGPVAAMLPENSAPRQMYDRANAAIASTVDRNEADYQRNVPDGAGSYAGAAFGEVAPWMYGLGEARAIGAIPQITKGGLLGLLQKAGLLAAEGGVIGGAQPVGEGDYATQKAAQVATGAIAAPLTAGALKGVGAGVGVLRDGARYLTPGGRETIANARVAKLYGGEPDVVTRLRGPSGVQGFDFTPAQALGTPEAVQTERVLRNNGNTAPAFAARESANNAAAREQVAGVAKDDPAMEAAKAARRRIDRPFRDKHLPEEGSALVDPAPVVGVLERLRLSGVDTVRQAARKHLGLLREHMRQNGGKIPAYALDDIRQGVGSTLRSIPNTGAVTPKEAVLYGSVSSAITDTLERAIPGYRNHLAAYARASQPINDMEAGRTLLAAIDSGGRDAGGNQAVSLTQVKALLSKDNRADFPMSESARKQIQAVLNVLQRRSIANNNVAAAGPGTAADVQRAVQASPLLMRLIGHSGGLAGGVTLGPMGFVGGALATEGATALNNVVARQVGQKAASAPRAADAIEAHMRAQQQRTLGNQPMSTLMKLLLPYEQRALPPRP